MVLFAMSPLASAQGLDAPVSSSNKTNTPITPIILDISVTSKTIAAEETTRRQEARQKLEQAITENPETGLIDDPELSLALVGDSAAIAAHRGTEAANAALIAAQANRCPDAIASANVALDTLAIAQAQGKTVDTGLRQAYAAQFICTYQTQQSSALLSANRLRSLGQHSPPQGVDTNAWARYPELDASANISTARLTIETTQPGAIVWLDHKRRGVSPLTIHVSQGPHLLAVANDHSGIAKIISITGWTHHEQLTIDHHSGGRWTTVATLVAQLRARTRAPDALAITEVMNAAGADTALVLVGGGTIEIWRLEGSSSAEGSKAKRVGQRRDPAQAVHLLVGAAQPQRPAPLLLKDDKHRQESTEPTPKWWVYAAVLGAATIGAGIIVIGQSRTDKQRFEISLP